MARRSSPTGASPSRRRLDRSSPQTALVRALVGRALEPERASQPGEPAGAPGDPGLSATAERLRGDRVGAVGRVPRPLEGAARAPDAAGERLGAAHDGGARGEVELAVDVEGGRLAALEVTGVDLGRVLAMPAQDGPAGQIAACPVAAGE